jgi:hypothetical protein
MTMGQLKSKRDEFWDTEPAFHGRQEIWQALKAAAECEDADTAQAIISAISVTYAPRGPHARCSRDCPRHSPSPDAHGWGLALAHVLPVSSPPQLTGTCSHAQLSKCALNYTNARTLARSLACQRAYVRAHNATIQTAAGQFECSIRPVGEQVRHPAVLPV